MPAESKCTWFFGGPAMEVHWKRLWWDFGHLFTNEKNPLPGGRKRKAWKDIGHAIVNIPVEYCRACPYRAGHIMFLGSVAFVASLVGNVVQFFG